MKRNKITSIIATIVMIIVCSLSLVACTEIFKVDPEKDAATPYLTIKYDVFERVVTKREFLQIYNSNAPQLIQRGKTMEEALDEVINALTERTIKAFKSRIYVAQRLGKDKKASYEELLTTSEIDRGIRQVNSQMLKRFVQILKEDVFDDKANKAEDTYQGKKGEMATVKLELPNGATIDKQELTIEVEKGKKLTKPTDPKFKDDSTKAFLGWRNKATGEKFDFEKIITEDITLEAVFGLKARKAMPTTINPDYKKDAEAYDADKEIPKEKITKKFFDLLKDEEYKYDGKDKWKFNEVDWFYALTADKKKKFFEQAETKLRKALNYKGKTGQEYAQYDKYLDEQYDNLLIEKRERMMYKDIKNGLTNAEVDDEYNCIYNIQKNELNSLWGDESAPAYDEDKNKKRHEKFVSYDKKDEKTNLYYGGYTNSDPNKYSGYVLNILFKLGKKETKDLVEKKNNGMKQEELLNLRNKYLKEMEVNVSNPKYNTSEKVKDKDGKIVDTSKIIDPATDPGFKEVRDYNAKYSDEDYEKWDEGYKNLVQFKKNAEGNYEIVFGAQEAPNVPYLRRKVKLYGTDGILEQIYNSLKQVDSVSDSELSPNQKLYWKQQVATAWLYMVGDDEGSTSSSNNNGKGYFVGAEGKGKFLEEFTQHARKLINNGTGSYSRNGTQPESYVIADSFTKSESKVNASSAYAGVFFLYNTKTNWDKNVKGIAKDKEGKITDNKVTMEFDDDTAKTPYDSVFNNSYNEEKTLTVKDLVFGTVAKNKFNAAKQEMTNQDKKDGEGKANMPKKIRRKLVRQFRKK